MAFSLKKDEQHKTQSRICINQRRGGGGWGWRRRCRSPLLWKWCRCTHTLMNVLLKYEYWMRVWVEGEVGEGAKMGRQPRKAEGEMETAERGISFFFFFFFCGMDRTFPPCDGIWTDRIFGESRTGARDATNVGDDLDLWSVILTQAGKCEGLEQMGCMTERSGSAWRSLEPGLNAV